VKPGYDILIIGGGLVGACIAGLLAADRHFAHLRIGLVEANPPSQPPPGSDIDIRVSAISHASQKILTAAGGWQNLDPVHLSPYTEMVVWDAAGQPNGQGSIHFSASNTGEPDLGHIVENRRLQWALYSAPALRDRVVLLRASLAGLAFDAGQAMNTATLSDGRRVTARLVIGADGAASHSRSLAGIEVTARAYDQSAVVTHVRTGHSHRQTAWQRFLPEGPLAFLPLADGRCSIVWSTTPEQADRLVDMPPADFERALLVASDAALGSIELAAPRARFPLQLMYAREYCRPGFVLVGDAAHAVHPLAGQGVNLGFADCAALAQVLAGSVAANQSGWADRRWLRRYERWRKSDNLLAASVIDGLGRLFSNADPRLRALRTTGLGLVDRSALAKRLLISRASR
jgi:2-polyprenylphenol 6-hydroxylase